MKRFSLLTLLVALFCVTAFAQKGLHLLPIKDAVQTSSVKMKAIDRKAQPVANRARRAGAELVTPPATAKVETWYTVEGKFYAYGSSGWVDATDNMKTINVAIDGTDMYIQGLAYWFPEGWIKGKMDGFMVLFDNGQFIGEDQYGAEYIIGSNDGETLSDGILFNYYEEMGILECITDYLIESSEADKVSPYCFWNKPVFSKTEPTAPEVVVAPSDLVTEEYSISYTGYNGAPSTGAVKIGFDGNDVYIQGFCSYIPEAWIKGEMSGTTVTFAGNQYFGNFGEQYDMFLQNSDAVFEYDATAGKFTAAATVYTYTGNYFADYYENLVMTKVIEKAGTPATPTITEVGDTEYGPAMFFNVPIFDTEGNGMLTSKLSYQFFVDVEQEISPLTFRASDYEKLDADMTVIPYGFTEHYDFYDTQIYLNMAEYNTFNKIGIQSTYTGGGEELKSEIFWYTIKDYSKTSFDFNALTDEPCSSSDSNAGDITADRKFEAGNVTLTVSPNPEGTPNRFWSTKNGPQLRVYGGTLTFEAAIGKVIKKIVFNNAKWNDNNSADTGAFDGATWTGEAKKVVVTIAGNTQLNSIDVETDDFVATPVEAPEGLTTETYIFSAIAVEAKSDPADEVAEPYSLQVKVGFDGNDAYIQGLSADVPELWVKATKNEAGQYVIPANQFMGVLSIWGGMFTFNYYFTAVDAEGNLVDAVLDYDAEKSLFTTAQTLVLNEGEASLIPYITFTNVSIEKFIEVAATPADPTFESVNFDATYPSIYCSLATVGTNGETLNLDKLFYTVWIEKDGVQQPYTFTASAYSGDFTEDVTEVPYAHDGYDLYRGGEIIYFEETPEELSTWTKVGIQTIYYGAGEVHKSNVVWGYNGTFIPTELVVNQSGYATFYDAYHNFVIPEGVKAYVVTAATTENLTYSELEGVIPAGTAVMLEGTAGTYPAVVSEEEAVYEGINLLNGSNIPTTTYADVEDCLFYKLAYGNSAGVNANKLGWYWGAENGAAFEIEAHRAWLAIPQIVASAPGYPFISPVTGISSTLADDGTDAVIYDLQGRRISTPAKGLYIKNNKKVIIK